MSDTSSITETTFRAAVLLCVQAIEDSDYTTARMRCLAADAVAAGLPVSASGAGSSAQRRSDLSRLLDSIIAQEQQVAMRTASRIINIATGRTDHGL